MCHTFSLSEGCQTRVALGNAPDDAPVPQEQSAKPPADNTSQKAEQAVDFTALSYKTRPTPATHVRNAWWPDARFSLAAEALHLSDGSGWTIGTTASAEWAHRRFTFFPRVKGAPVPISVLPRIEGALNPEFQAVTGGISIYAGPADWIALLVKLGGGYAHISENPSIGREASHNFIATWAAGPNVRLPIRKVLIQTFVEYSGAAFLFGENFLHAHGVNAGLRMRF